MDRMDMVVNGDAKVFYGTTFDVLHWLSLRTAVDTADLYVVVGGKDRVPVRVYVLDNSPKTIYTKLMDHRISNEQLGSAEQKFLDYMGMTRTEFKMHWNTLNGRQQNDIKMEYLIGREPKYR